MAASSGVIGSAAFRFARLTWLFGAIITVADKDLTDQPREPAPEISKAWSSNVPGGGL